MMNNLSIFAAAALALGADGNEQKPNIIFVLADDLGFRDVGWHGSEAKTPVLDELVKSGIDLSQWHGHSICTPSRASLMTGRYAFHTGLQHSFIQQGAPIGLPLNISTLADGLKKAGYSTHMVGKWHLGFTSWEYTPLERGFDTFFGYLGGGEDYYTHDEGGFYDFRDECTIAKDQRGNYSTTVFVDKAIEQLQKQSTKDPFFLFLSLQSVHAPLESPPNYQHRYPEIANKNRRTMAQMVSAMDEEIGRLLAQVKQLGFWKNTLLFFCSDNGGPPYVANSNWPFRGGKWTMWQGGAHVAALVTHGDPSVLGSGRQFPFLTHHMDLLPTLLAAAGVDEHPQGVDGTNLWPYWTKQRSAEELRNRSLVLNVDPTNTRAGIHDAKGWGGYAAIRNLEWKLMLGNGGTPNGLCWPPAGSTGNGTCKYSGNVPADLDTPHLYHLASDPSESFDLATKHPDVVAQMTSELDKYIKSAWEPLNKYSAGRTCAHAATLAAQKNGAWSPWEKCASRKCKCERTSPDLTITV